MEVRLTEDECALADFVGARRQLAAESRGLRDAYGLDPAVARERHVEGCRAEIAFAKAANVYWTSPGAQADKGDVGRYEVRSTDRAGGSLILHPKDPDRVFVLVVAKTPVLFDVVGWIYASAGKAKRFWRDDVRHPAFFVPPRMLAPLERLPGRRWTLDDPGLPPLSQVAADRKLAA